MSKECTTHHHACDCREEKFKELERENKQLRQTVLETLSQRGQRELIVAWDRAKELERENAALRADKERLDWLSSQKDQPWLYWERPLRLTREAIDAFRKEAQP
jgi:hypothetical protein